MSAQHTQGRVKVQHPDAGERGLEVAFEPGLERLCADITEANARRLVACWNACEGLPDEFLNSNPIKQLVQSVWDRNSELEGQRDELLAALRMVMACAGDISAAPDGLLEMALDDGDEETRRQANAFLVARAAIAKATGEKQ